jgi:hypothetical protein
VPTQRDLKINFNLFRTLQSALILNKNMDEIKEHRDLTEFQREKLIDFLMAAKHIKLLRQVSSLRNTSVHN